MHEWFMKISTEALDIYHVICTLLIISDSGTDSTQMEAKRRRRFTLPKDGQPKTALDFMVMDDKRKYEEQVRMEREQRKAQNKRSQQYNISKERDEAPSSTQPCSTQRPLRQVSYCTQPTQEYHTVGGGPDSDANSDDGDGTSIPIVMNPLAQSDDDYLPSAQPMKHKIHTSQPSGMSKGETYFIFSIVGKNRTGHVN